jgi:hypothetical protein|tara:strand:- start:16631 stop:16963 length:333 start_codon:yes stop_codon:yes gene_type:complete
MKVLTIKGTNLAQQLIADKFNPVITQIDTVAYNKDGSKVSGKGSTLSINGEVVVLAQRSELELHDDVLEQRIIGSGDSAIEYTCLKGIDVKEEDFVHDAYTYDGSTWAAV